MLGLRAEREQDSLPGYLYGMLLFLRVCLQLPFNLVLRYRLVKDWRFPEALSVQTRGSKAASQCGETSGTRREDIACLNTGVDTFCVVQYRWRCYPGSPISPPFPQAVCLAPSPISAAVVRRVYSIITKLKHEALATTNLSSSCCV